MHHDWRLAPTRSGLVAHHRIVSGGTSRALPGAAGRAAPSTLDSAMGHSNVYSLACRQTIKRASEPTRAAHRRCTSWSSPQGRFPAYNHLAPNLQRKSLYARNIFAKQFVLQRGTHCDIQLGQVSRICRAAELRGALLASILRRHISHLGHKCNTTNIVAQPYFGAISSPDFFCIHARRGRLVLPRFRGQFHYAANAVT